MKKIIKLFEDYGAGLLWTYDENGVLEYNDVPDEWENETELINNLYSLKQQLEAQYVDDEYGFRYVGYKDEKAKKAYYDLLDKVRVKIKELLPSDWEFIDKTIYTNPIN